MRHLVLGIAVAVTSLMPVVGMADDQQIAEYVKSRLKAEQDAGNLKGFNVDMRVDGGTVWFEGFVSSPKQQMTILRTAQQAGHLGVIQVVDDIEVKNASPYRAAAAYKSPVPTVQPASYRMPAAAPAPMPARVAAPAPVRAAAPVQQYTESYHQPMPFASCEGCATGVAPVETGYVDSGYSEGGYVDSGYSGGGYADNSYPAAGCATGGYAGDAYAGGGQPMAAGQAGGPGAAGGEANLPGYAWPAYAAAPNYGAVSYPRQHSASAWPYIGPFYPYPQVPLGWRKVTLEWDDGWWNLDFHDK